MVTWRVAPVCFQLNKNKNLHSDFKVWKDPLSKIGTIWFKSEITKEFNSQEDFESDTTFDANFHHLKVLDTVCYEHTLICKPKK